MQGDRHDEVLFEYSFDAIVRVDQAHRILAANRSFLDLFGYTEVELLGQDLDRMVTNEESYEKAKYWSDRIEDRRVYIESATRFSRKGHPIEVIVAAIPVVEENRVQGAFVIYRDVTDEHRARQELLKQNRIFESLFLNATDAIVRIDGEERVLEINSSFQKIFGFDPEEIVGKKVDALIASPGEYEKNHHLTKTLLSGEKVVTEGIRYQKCGDPKNFVVQGVPIMVEGQAIGGFGIYTDISDQKDSQRALEAQKVNFEALFKNASDAIVRLDDKERIVDVNGRFKDIFGYTLEEVEGMNLDDLIQLDPQDKVNRGLTQTLLQGEQIISEGPRKTRWGKKSFFVRGVPIIVSGEVVGGYGIYTDITERKETERALAAQKVDFEALFKNSSDAIVRIDTKERILDINETFEERFGYQLHEVIGLPIDPLIVPKNEVGTQNQLTKNLLTGKQVVAEGLRLTKGGLAREFSIRGVPIIVEGQVMGGYGIYTDITEKKRAERSLMEQKIILQALFTNSSEAIVRFDIDHRILEINEPFTELFGFGFEEIKGKAIDDVITDHEQQGATKNLTKILLEGRKITAEGRRYGKNREPVEVSVKGVPIVVEGQVVGGYGIYTDISERKAAEKEILYLSHHDELTGLYNRRFFEEESLRMDVARQHPIGLIMTDVNGLKLTNDAFGHDAGDRLLRKVADLIKNTCRSEEIIARLGGDEFVILLPRSSEKSVEAVARRIRRTCQRETLHGLPLSVAVGWGVKTRPEEGVTDLMKRAEEKMYRRKLMESSRYRSRIFRIIVEELHRRSPREKEHAQKVGVLAEAMAEALGFDKHHIDEMKRAGLYHDIGKIALDEEALDREGAYSVLQWREMQRHPEISYRILHSMHEMSELAEIILAHHERVDGTGYPKGLVGDKIPYEARILSVCDAFEAMTAPRGYREVLSYERAAEELQRQSGSQFDPELVAVFIDQVVPRLGEILP